MNVNQPPKVARWLLERFGCSANNEAVIGDLDERYGRNPSRLWYWRQVMVAIWHSLLTEVRMNPTQSFLAVVTGWILVIVYTMLHLKLIAPWLEQKAMTAGWVAITAPGSWPIHVGLSGIVMLAIGWIVARSHVPHHRASVLLLVLTLYVPCIIKLCFHLMRAHDTSGTFMDFVFNVVDFSAVLVGGWLVHNPPLNGNRGSALSDLVNL